MPTLRVLSVDAHPLGHDRAALAQLINDADPDAVCVHNAPHLGRWRNKVGALARATGRVVVTAGGRRGGANVLLTTLAVDAPITGLHRFTAGGGTNPAGAALALLRTEGAEVLLAAATLHGSADQRLVQAGELTAAVERLVPGTPPAILAVAGIDRAGTPAYRVLTERRPAVGTRLFVDDPIAVADQKEVGGTPALLTVLEF